MSGKNIFGNKNDEVSPQGKGPSKREEHQQKKLTGLEYLCEKFFSLYFLSWSQKIIKLVCSKIHKLYCVKHQLKIYSEYIIIWFSHGKP
jgi:hypothetical protein